VPHGARVQFDHGIPGFESVAEWQFALDPAVKPFLYLTAGDRSVQFVCVETFRIRPDYCLHLPGSAAKTLGLTTQSSVALLSIVTVHDAPEDTTANLMSPLLVNLDRLLGKQIIHEDSPYPLRYRIWETLCLEQTCDEIEQLAAV
jgi:flagellar assembly factor FliW